MRSRRTPKLSDDELRQKTADWKAQLSRIQDKTELAGKLNEILPEAFAVVKKRLPPAHRTQGGIIVREHPLLWEMIPFDVQLIGGYACTAAHLRNGHRRRQDAGCHPAVYLNALTGRGVHW